MFYNILESLSWPVYLLIEFIENFCTESEPGCIGLIGNLLFDYPVELKALRFVDGWYESCDTCDLCSDTPRPREVDDFEAEYDGACLIVDLPDLLADFTEPFPLRECLSLTKSSFEGSSSTTEAFDPFFILFLC